MIWSAIPYCGAAALLAVLVATPAHAAPAVPAGWIEEHSNERSERCDLQAEHRVGNRLLLACGAAGVWVLDASDAAAPRFVNSSPTPGDAVGFFEEPPGRVWVKLRRLEARPFDPERSPSAIKAFPDEVAPSEIAAASSVHAAATPPAPAPAPAPAPPRAERGTVVRSVSGHVLVSLGSADGVHRGDRLELTSELEPDADALLGSRKIWAVGTVVNLTEWEADVVLGLNEMAPVGARAVPTPAQPTAGIVAPPRVSGLWELEVGARPFFAVEELGGGVLFNASIGRRIGALHLQALLDPVGFGDVKEGDSIGTASGTLLASYDSQYFELGVGVGAQTMNDSSSVVPPGSGLSMSQLLRIGTHDGLNLMLRSSVVLFHSELGFGGMVGVLQIPIARRAWLRIGGGGGQVGYGYGELAVRALLAGNGFAGSRYFTVSGGVGGVFRSGSCDADFFECTGSTTYVGPMLGFGHEWRF